MNFSISARNKWGTRSFWNGRSFGCHYFRMIYNSEEAAYEGREKAEKLLWDIIINTGEDSFSNPQVEKEHDHHSNSEQRSA